MCGTAVCRAPRGAVRPPRRPVALARSSSPGWCRHLTRLQPRRKDAMPDDHTQLGAGAGVGQPARICRDPSSSHPCGPIIQRTPTTWRRNPTASLIVRGCSNCQRLLCLATFFGLRAPSAWAQAADHPSNPKEGRRGSVGPISGWQVPQQVEIQEALTKVSESMI